MLLQEHLQCFKKLLYEELGTRQHRRKNVTTFSGQKAVGYRTMPIFGVAFLFRHRDLNIFLIFSVDEALLRYRTVIVAIAACPALIICISLQYFDVKTITIAYSAKIFRFGQAFLK